MQVAPDGQFDWNTYSISVTSDDPAVTMLQDGTFVVSYTHIDSINPDNGGIYTHRYEVTSAIDSATPLVAPITNAVLVNDPFTDVYHILLNFPPSGTALAGGLYVVVDSIQDKTTNDTAIVGQLFDENDQKVGDLGVIADYQTDITKLHAVGYPTA